MISVNGILNSDITKINSNLLPPGFQGDIQTVRLMQDTLVRIIDDLGQRSASAQGLKKIITTADKLRNSPTQMLYLLKDAMAKNGKGDVIGLLKVGRKHLFLFDERDQVHEVEPMCVLDFFVVCDRQRHGFGRLLYDHMLLDLGTTAHALPVDGPSPLMEHFLAKNYGVLQLMRQSNNFAVSRLFFNNSGPDIRSDSCSAGAATPSAVGRFAALKPHSAIATVIHGGARRDLHELAAGASAPAALEVEPPPPGPPRGAEARAPERPASLRVAPAEPPAAPPAAPAAADNTPTPGSRRDAQYTEGGFFDMKFYHNKLW